MKIKAIILAAGNSKRFGKEKLLEGFQGKPLIMHVIEEVLKVEFEEIILVTQYEEVEKLINTRNIRVVRNKNVDKGISHSIHLGISEGGSCEGYMFIVGDQPFVTCEIIEGMINQFRKEKGQILCISHEGRRGSPTLFDACYKEELLSLEGDIGGKQVMKRHPECVETYEVKDFLVLEDIDTREDYERLVIQGRAFSKDEE